MRGSFAIGRVGGIQIRLHFTFLLVLPVIAFVFARVFANFRSMSVLAGVPPAQLWGSPLSWGVMLAFALFASVLVHELAHALYAIHRGGKVRDITLLMIGGVSNLSQPPRTPGQEAWMALVGPLTSIGLSILCYGVYALLGATSWTSLRFAIFYLGGLNLALGLFNLLPAFPMDGGRVLRGALATRIGQVRATRIAATLGKVFALLFVVASFFTFNFFLMIIAFFVYIGAEAESEQVVAKSVLGEIRVSDLVHPAPPTLEATETVEDAAAAMVRDRQVALLVRRGDELLGIVTVEGIEKVPPGDRPATHLSQVVRGVPPVSPASNLWDALRIMREARAPLVPVVEAGRVLGAISEEEIIQSLRLYQLERRPRPTLRRAPSRA